MWVVRNDHACKSHGISWPGLPALSLALLTNRAIGHARLMHKELSTPEAKSQGPRTKSQGTRGKDQEPRNKPLSCMDPHVQPSIIYIYIYICIYIHASLRDPNFPSSRLPYIVPDFHAGLRSFNFPDSQILSDKLSDPNLTPFPNPMHARIKYFARSHCCKDKCTFTKT